jgi:hypothetical protein
MLFFDVFCLFANGGSLLRDGGDGRHAEGRGVHETTGLAPFPKSWQVLWHPKLEHFSNINKNNNNNI